MAHVRIWLSALSLCLLLLASSAGNVNASGASVDDSDENGSEGAESRQVVMVGIPGVASCDLVAGQLQAMGVDILERYEAMVLASVSAPEMNALSSMGFDVVDQPKRTLTGRGSYVFDTRYGEPNMRDDLRVGQGEASEYGTYIVQFIGPIKSEWIETIRWMGADVFDYLPSFSFIVAADEETLSRIVALPFVQWTGTYHPAYKLAPSIESLEVGSAEIVMALFPGADPAGSVVEIEAGEGYVLNTWNSDSSVRITASVPIEVIWRLANLPEVNWIQETSTYLAYNNQATWVLQSNSSDMRPVFAHGVNGTNQTVTVADTGVDLAHEMFWDPQNDPVGPDHRKVGEYYVPYGASGLLGDECGHGTHVLGTLLGDAPVSSSGNALYWTYSEYDGHAFGARSIFQDIDNASDPYVYPPDDLTNLFQPSYESSSRIHTNSWGGGYNVYGYDSETIDAFIWNHPDYLVFFAAGNLGPWSGTISEQGNAKNIVTVGASGNGLSANDVAVFSSRGLAGDGRIKPTLMTPGQYVTSAQAGTVDGYVTHNGTSMATPAAAGCAALVRDYFQSGFYPTGVASPINSMNPSAALVKAVLLDSTVEMTGAYAYDPVSGTYVFLTDSITTSPPYAVYLQKENSNDWVNITSSHVDLDYSQDYVLDLNFYLDGYANTLGNIVYDGRAHIGFEYGPDELCVWGADSMVSVTVSSFQWYSLKVSYHPSVGTYDVDLNGTRIATAMTFRGAAQETLSIGTPPITFVWPKHWHFWLVVDDIRYSGVGGAVYFSEDFNDGNIDDWTIVGSFGSVIRAYPNANQGWGRVNLDNALYFHGDSARLLAYDESDGFTDSGQVRQYLVRVIDSTVPLKVTLVWSDYPGSPYGVKALVNDLDLLVIDPLGNSYKGNYFTGLNSAQSEIDGVYDSLNVEEMVLRLEPTLGDWTISVASRELVYGPQPFALTVTGAVCGEDEMELPIFHDFDAGLEAYWQTEDSGGYVGLWTDDQTLSQGLRLTKSGSSGISWTRRYFEPQYGSLELEADLRVVNTTSCAYFLAWNSEYQTYTITFGVFDAVFSWFNESGIGWTAIMDAVPGQWYGIRLDLDMASGIYDIYIDDVKVWDNARMRGPAPYGVDAVMFQAGWPDGYYSNIDMRIDNLQVYLPVPATPPSPPQDLSGYYSQFLDCAYIYWDEPSSDGGSPITEYRIYRGIRSGKVIRWSYLDSTADLSYCDYDVELGKTYYYYVTAVNAVGESDPSNQVSVKVPRK